MGLIRKLTSVSTLGAVDFKSDKERAAKNTKKTAVESKRQTAEAIKQTALLEQLATARSADLPSAHATPDPWSASSRSTSLVDELRGLAELRDSGVLTQEEFDDQKRRLLAER